MQPISVRGTLWSATLGVACLGLAVGSRRSLRVAAVAGLAWLATAAVTIAWPDEQRFLRAIVLPSGDDAGRAGRLFAERDVSLVGVRAMHAIGGVSDREIEGFAGPLDGVYDEMEALDGAVVVTPFVSTAFGSQSADRFDAFVHHERGSSWILFLHGFGGSFASYCWVIARAAAEEGWSTACPATSFPGRWQLGDGPEIARRTVDFMRERGARRIVLVGLSNGGIAASAIPRELSADLVGLVLVSGLDPRAPAPGIPTLVWHGTHDERFSIEWIREWVARTPGAELVEVDGDHFALIEQRAELAVALRAFLSRLGHGPDQ